MHNIWGLVGWVCVQMGSVSQVGDLWVGGGLANGGMLAIHSKKHLTP